MMDWHGIRREGDDDALSLNWSMKDPYTNALAGRGVLFWQLPASALSSIESTRV
ncbi:hypothetical protein [Lonsdalea quercina]|uniref:hypothetical protein n=1 Tax=Lonsdalea quercina TaxID=71657 RepID=UPI0039754AA8